MAFTCSCTNQCPACGQCCQVQCGHRRSAGTYFPPSTVPVVPYTPPRPRPAPVTVRPPLTADDVRRLVREGIQDALEELRQLREADPSASRSPDQAEREGV